MIETADTYRGDEGRGRFECPVCGLRWITLGGKRRHMRAEHPNK